MNDVPGGELEPVALSFVPDAETVEWTVRGMRLTEGLNEPYELRIEIESDDFAAEPAKLLGVSASVYIERGELERVVNGIIASVDEHATGQDEIRPILTIVPAFRALDQRRTSRIFQEKTVPEILREVLEEGVGPYDRSIDTQYLSGNYPVQEYTVQYRETDRALVERLMEENGIGYMFTHEGKTETMVLFDSDSPFTDLVSSGNQDGVLPIVLRDTESATREDVRKFHRTSQLRPTVARTLVFDWMAPDTLQEDENDEAAELGTVNGAGLEPKREDFDHAEPSTLAGYRSAGLDFEAVKADTRLRRQLHNRDAVRCKGSSTAIGLRPGVSFELLDHPQPELDAPYFVVRTTHTAGNLASESETYVNEFECLPREVQWRPDRKHPRPRISGIQTAVVVGPAGEEIHTDAHGRIKLMFNWNRDGTRNENSSCWVRVMQTLAGPGYGSFFLPRIGMEVVVTFLDGDCDRPVVTGCLYNGANVTPYGLPDEKTKSTIKTISTPGGGGFNEFRFEDAKGAEEIFLHAQKDFNEEVENNHTTLVGGNQKNEVKGDHEEKVDGKQELKVGGLRDIKVNGDFSETLEKKETREVKGDVKTTFHKNEEHNVGLKQVENVGTEVVRGVGANVTDTIGGKLSQTVTKGFVLNSPASYQLGAVKGIMMTTAGSMTVTATGGYTLLAPGGASAVDSTQDTVASSSKSTIGQLLNFSAQKFETCGVAGGVTAMKMEMCGVALSKNVVANASQAIDIASIKFQINNGMISIDKSALKMIG